MSQRTLKYFGDGELMLQQFSQKLGRPPATFSLKIVMVAATQCTKAVYNKRKCNTITGMQYSGLLTPGQKASTEQLYDITNNRSVTMSISIGA